MKRSANPITIAALIALSAGCVDVPLDRDEQAATRLPPPALYHDPLHESPVRGDPKDVLLLPGNHLGAEDVVVYAKLPAGGGLPVRPTTPPAGQTATTGTIAPFAAEDTALKIVLPAVITPERTYALWVAAPGLVPGSFVWSTPILINDARPVWVSPSWVYATQDRPGLVRQLKVIGRNLEPTPGSTTRVRLTNLATNATWTASATIEWDVGRFVASIALPAALTAGHYAVAVSRDGANWVTMSSDTGWFDVLDDPITSAFTVPIDSPIPVGQCGVCAANDGLDDTCCLVAAINVAKNLSGGADVIIPDRPCGTSSANCNGWEIKQCPAGSEASCYPGYGIVLPDHVNLRGDNPSRRSVISTLPSWDAAAGPRLDDHGQVLHEPDGGVLYVQNVLFSAQGHNVISGIRFHDVSTPSAGPAHPNTAMIAIHHDHVTVTNDRFEFPYYAILGDTSLPEYPVKSLTDIVITNNEIASWFEGLALSTLMIDTIVTGNTLWPGAAADSTNGAIALGTTGSYRVDVSSNQLDGTVHTYSDPARPGWRAGMFFAEQNGQEMLLVSKNTITCAGTKLGDGEAIQTDDKLNDHAFLSAKDVLWATLTQVRVANLGEMPLPAAHYVGFWLQIDAGTGLGQTRKIIAATPDTLQTNVTFTVSPAFDVQPMASGAGALPSRVTVTNQAWQAYFVGNTVNNSVGSPNVPMCPTTNDPALSGKGGMIGFFGATAEVAVENNTQLDTGGIFVDVSYHDFRDPADASCTQPQQWGHYFDEIRGNTIVGQFGNDAQDQVPANTTNVQGSGIQLRSIVGGGAVHRNSPLACEHVVSAVPIRDVMAYGLSISHNTITNAHWPLDASNSGAALGIRADSNVNLSPDTPGYVDTLMFANVLSTTPTTPAYGILNGDPRALVDGRNAPQGSVVCGNTFGVGWPNYLYPYFADFGVATRGRGTWAAGNADCTDPTL